MKINRDRTRIMTKSMSLTEWFTSFSTNAGAVEFIDIDLRKLCRVCLNEGETEQFLIDSTISLDNANFKLKEGSLRSIIEQMTNQKVRHYLFNI